MAESQINMLINVESNNKDSSSCSTACVQDSASQEGNPLITEIKITDNDFKENRCEIMHLTHNRELKSILELAKEANMDTNIGYKRNSEQVAKKSVSLQSVSVPINEIENQTQTKDKDDFIKTNKRRENINDLHIGGAIDESIKKNTRMLHTADLRMSKENKDLFCWRCHRDGVGISCETCPRSFHSKCLKQSITNAEHWPCPECVAILKAESTITRSSSLRGISLEHLCGLLKFAHKRMIQCTGSEPFIKPVDEKEFPDYKKYIVQPMDLNKLEKNIKGNLYGSTHAFEADAKWILHNSIIFNGFHSKLSTTAKAIVKICKQEMAEIENCSSCYRNANTKKNSWFVEVCPKPHLLLWAKLKGFPYWPAKSMRINSSGMVDVRFFGAHDRAWVPLKECFLFSRKDPNSNKQKRNDINNCVKELEVHIENLKKIYGEFNYAPYRTSLDPENEIKQLQILLPNYKAYSPSVFDKKNSENIEESKKIDLCLEQTSISQNITESDLNDSKCVVDVDMTRDSLEKNINLDSEKGMEGYGTDEECDDKIDTDKRKILKNISNCSGNDNGNLNVNLEFKNNESSTQAEAATYEESNKSYDIDNQHKICLLEEKIKTCTSVLGTKRLSTEDFVDIPQKLSRRNSDQSIKSDSSRLSGISDKISHIDISENMEITLGNDKIGNISISENFSSSDMSDSSKSESLDVEAKRKHIVQVDIENKEFTISPQNKLKIADHLIKKFAESEKSIDFQDTEEILDKANSVQKCINYQTKIESDKLDRNEGLRIDEKDSSKGIEDTSKHEVINKNESEMLITTSENSNIVKTIDISNSEDTQIDELKIKTIIKCSNDVAVTPKPLYDIKTDLEKKANKNKTAKKRKFNKCEINRGHLNKTIHVKGGNDMETTESNLNSPNNQNLDTTAEDILADSTINIKHEPLTDTESDSECIEAKKKYLSALNISERHSSEESTKRQETQICSQIFVVDNLTKVIDNVASSYSQEHEGEEITLKKLQKVKEGTTKVGLNNLNKPKARKSFPTPIRNQTVKKDAKTLGGQLTNNTHVKSQSLSVLPLNQTFSHTTNMGSSIVTKNKNMDSRNDISNTLSEQSSNNLPSVESLSATLTNSEGEPNEIRDDLLIFRESLPDEITKSISKIFSQLPRLRPRPPSILHTNFDEGLPSSAGPVTSRINSISHRLGDYFRGMLIETLKDLGTSENPEVVIVNLKLENETLKQKHATEMLEIKKNVCSILKDMQKSVSEERERIIEETRAACEAETIKRVEDAKSKQWCANCFNEAQFYCCWNTSYCDYPCQQKHWPKHMSKCIQNVANSRNSTESTSTSTHKSQGSIVLRQTTAPKMLSGKTYLAKPTKVIVNRTSNKKGHITQIVKSTTSNHLTLVESTPGNFELVGNGPISLGGKLITTTSVMSKIKSGNITVSSPSTASTAISSVNRQFANSKIKSPSNFKTVTTLMPDFKK